MSRAINKRATVWVGFYGAILLCWGLLFLTHGTVGASAPTVSFAYLDGLCITAAETGFAGLFAMWCLMSLAMMLPTFVSALRVFDELSDCGASSASGLAALIGGYLSIWIGFAALGAFVQSELSARALVTHEGASLSYGLNAVLLIFAGAYQFSSVKDSCLSKCRQPLSFFMQYWSPGNRAALRMGVRLGAYCLGCCWALMAIGFVGGMMNLVWMGAATLFMAFEKLPSIGRYLTAPAGIACLLAGAAFAARTLNVI